MPMPTASSRRATTSSAARFSATNSTRLPVGDRAGEQVGDRLRLAGAGRALEHEGAAGVGLGDRPQLRGVGRGGQLGGELVEVDVVAGVAGRVLERLGRLVHQVGDQRVLREVGPVLVEVLPQPELGELQDREVRRRLDPVGQPVPDQRDAHRLAAPASRSSGAVGGLGQRRDDEAVQLAQLLQQAVVRGAARRPRRATAGRRRCAPAALSVDRDEHQRRAQRAAVELPDQAAERQVQVVGAGLLLHGLRLVGEVAQPRQVAAGGDVGVHLAPLDEQLGQLLLGQLAGGGEPALLLDGGELVGRQQGDRRAVVDEVLEDAAARCRARPAASPARSV